MYTLLQQKGYSMDHATLVILGNIYVYMNSTVIFLFVHMV